MSNNHLCVIDPELFSGLKELSIITLSHNKIVSIDKNFFKGLVKLSIIDMSHNRLEVIENDFLSGLVKSYHGRTDGQTKCKTNSILGNNKFD